MAIAGPALGADYTLSINTALTTDDPLYKGLESFRDAVAEHSKGAIEVKLFPNSQLGPDEDVLEQARAGAPVAVVVDGGRLAVFQKEFGVLGAPYLAQGYEGIRKVVTSPVFEEWVKKLHDSSGHQVLSFNWWQGERELWTNKPVSTPADLAGVRMRTPGAPVWTETVKAMGATPTPMGWADVYSALQQNVIDAVEAQLPAGQGSKLYEVTKYLTKTHHINLITGLVTSVQGTLASGRDVGRAAVDVGHTASVKSARLKRSLKSYWSQLKGKAREERIRKMLAGRGLKPKSDTQGKRGAKRGRRAR